MFLERAPVSLGSGSVAAQSFGQTDSYQLAGRVKAIQRLLNDVYIDCKVQRSLLLSRHFRTDQLPDRKYSQS